MICGGRSGIRPAAVTLPFGVTRALIYWRYRLPQRQRVCADDRERINNATVTQVHKTGSPVIFNVHAGTLQALQKPSDCLRKHCADFGMPREALPEPCDIRFC